eukprot:1048037-Amorphochlora_amoeboformis.AAC.1
MSRFRSSATSGACVTLVGLGKTMRVLIFGLWQVNNKSARRHYDHLAEGSEYHISIEQPLKLKVTLSTLRVQHTPSNPLDNRNLGYRTGYRYEIERKSVYVDASIENVDKVATTAISIVCLMYGIYVSGPGARLLATKSCPSMLWMAARATYILTAILPRKLNCLARVVCPRGVLLPSFGTQIIDTLDSEIHDIFPRPPASALALLIRESSGRAFLASDFEMISQVQVIAVDSIQGGKRGKRGKREIGMGGEGMTYALLVAFTDVKV